jgi:hypothetical protein
MHRSRISHTGRSIRRTAVMIATLVVLLFGRLSAGGRAARAQTANLYTTTTSVAPGGTLTMMLASAGATIGGSTSIAGCPLTGLYTATVTYSCSASGLGIPAGTAIFQTLALPGGRSSETVTYNANGPVAGAVGVAAATTDRGSCTAPDTLQGPVTCATQTSAGTIAGGSLVLRVTGATSQDIRITAAPVTLGSCQLATSVPLPPSDAGGSESITYICAAGQSIPSGTTLSVTVGTAARSPSAPAVSASDNANAPLPASPAIPAPTFQTVSAGVLSPSLASISPSSGSAGTVISLTGANLNSATAISFTTPSGEIIGASAFSCAASGTSCTATVPSLPAGTPVSVTVTTADGTSNALGFSSVVAPTVSPLTAAFLSVVTSGQTVTFTAVTVSPSAPCGIGVGYSFNFGDGSPVQTTVSLSAMHTYTGAGVYRVVLIVTDCTGQSATATTTVPITAGATATPTPTPTPAPGIDSAAALALAAISVGTPVAASMPAVPLAISAGVSGALLASEAGTINAVGSQEITFPAGWNLIGSFGGPSSIGNDGPLYTFQDGDTAYEVIASGTELAANEGYWVYFDTSTVVTLFTVIPEMAQIALPAGAWILIANNGEATATVTGADLVYVYSPITGAQATTTLDPGQGAWAFSANGGTATISSP